MQVIASVLSGFGFSHHSQPQPSRFRPTTCGPTPTSAPQTACPNNSPPCRPSPLQPVADVKPDNLTSPPRAASPFLNPGGHGRTSPARAASKRVDAAGTHTAAIPEPRKARRKLLSPTREFAAPACEIDRQIAADHALALQIQQEEHDGKQAAHDRKAKRSKGSRASTRAPADAKPRETRSSQQPKERKRSASANRNKAISDADHEVAKQLQRQYKAEAAAAFKRSRVTADDAMGSDQAASLAGTLLSGVKELFRLGGGTFAVLDDSETSESIVRAIDDGATIPPKRKKKEASVDKKEKEERKKAPTSREIAELLGSGAASVNEVFNNGASIDAVEAAAAAVRQIPARRAVEVVTDGEVAVLAELLQSGIMVDELLEAGASPAAVRAAADAIQSGSHFA